MASPIARALTLIYQASYEQGQVPDDLKRAFVTPLFKKGDKSKASNYRPVSLTSCCCKVMEHIVHSILMKFLENNKFLSDYQHGFKKKRSCETQLITTVLDLAVGLDRRQQVDSILLDFSKAFNKVPISTLQSSSSTMASETKTYPGSKAFSRIEISKWSLMGRHHLVLLSHPEFHKAQCLELSCSWYTSMACPQEFPLQYDLLLMIVCCIVIRDQQDAASLQTDLNHLQERERMANIFIPRQVRTHPDHKQARGHTDFLQYSRSDLE